MPIKPGVRLELFDRRRDFDAPDRTPYARRRDMPPGQHLSWMCIIKFRSGNSVRRRVRWVFQLQGDEVGGGASVARRDRLKGFLQCLCRWLAADHWHPTAHGLARSAAIVVAQKAANTTAAFTA